MKRRIFITVLAAALLGAALLTYRGGFWHAASDLKSEPPSSAWPMDRAWSWSFQHPDLDARHGISLCVRLKSSILPPNSTPGISSPSRAMSARDATREFGTSTVVRGTGTMPRSGHVSIQLLDLSKAGVVSTMPGRDLRVLATLRMGGTETSLGGNDIFLPAGRFAGYSAAGDGRWNNNELYLMTFWVEGDGSVFQYDVLLERAALPG